MGDVFICKNCWNFHAKGKAEQGTCRARLKPVKTNRDSRCAYPEGFTVHRIVATYTIVSKRGGRIGGIADVNQAIEMYNELNEQYRKQLTNYRKEQNNGMGH